MDTPTDTIRFEARLQRPAMPRNATWTFVVLPIEASTRLPTRGMTSVEGTFEGQAFKATLEPDGQGSHWLKVPCALCTAAQADIGRIVALEIAPSRGQLEPRVPVDLRTALRAAPDAYAQWTTLTPTTRRDFIQWLNASKKAETRTRRIATACDMLAAGKRRICCFDRSGLYSKALGAPMAAD